MTEHKSQVPSNGKTTIPIMVVVGAICTWCAGLSVGLYTVNGQTASLTASVADIKDTLDSGNLPVMKAELDFLASQRGFKITPIASSSSQPYVQTAQQ